MAKRYNLQVKEVKMFYLDEKTRNIICQALLRAQVEDARNIRMFNRRVFTCYGKETYLEKTAQEIRIFNERVELLRRFVTDDFKNKLGPDDLKLWEELPFEKRWPAT